MRVRFNNREGVCAMARKVLLTGIKVYKGVSDLRGCINDAFSYDFHKAMRDTDGTTAPGEPVRRVHESLVFHAYSQTPHLESEATVRAVRAFTFAERRSDGLTEGRGSGLKTRSLRHKISAIPELPTRTTLMKFSK
jgi:hypothetical protein